MRHFWDKVLIIAILALIAVAILFVGWKLFSALGNALKIKRARRITLYLLFLLVSFTVWMLDLHSMNANEIACWQELRKSKYLMGAEYPRITKHVDGWTGGYSCCLMSYAPPYTDPVVFLWVTFKRDGYNYKASGSCRFSKIPNSGDPPEIKFDKLEFMVTRSGKI